MTANRQQVQRQHAGATQPPYPLRSRAETTRERVGEAHNALVLGTSATSVQLQQRITAEVLTEAEVLSQMTLFLFAGLDTTKNMLGSGLLGVLQNPDQLALIHDDAAAMRTAVQEMLRFDSPIQFLHRVVAQDGELCGTPVRSRVYVTQNTRP